ncbi:MAG: hypothetical protein MUP16_05435 [Sedimentisphaerales bacterium]|nr:hypothetical protein [Sedimentisphaerales bacterium]
MASNMITVAMQINRSRRRTSKNRFRTAGSNSFDIEDFPFDSLEGFGYYAAGKKKE